MKLNELLKYNTITIQCHDNPDADSIASGYGLYCFFASKDKDVKLIYSGRNELQKSNLRLMLDKLNIPLIYVPVGVAGEYDTGDLLITVSMEPEMLQGLGLQI